MFKTITLAAIKSYKADDKDDDDEQSDKAIARAIGRTISIGGNIKNLSKVKIIWKLTKSKKLDFTKAKKPDSTNRASGIDFLTPKAKKKHWAAYKKSLLKY